MGDVIDEINEAGGNPDAADGPGFVVEEEEFGERGRIGFDGDGLSGDFFAMVRVEASVDVAAEFHDLRIAGVIGARFRLGGGCGGEYCRRQERQESASGKSVHPRRYYITEVRRRENSDIWRPA